MLKQRRHALINMIKELSDHMILQIFFNREIKEGIERIHAPTTPELFEAEALKFFVLWLRHLPNFEVLPVTQKQNSRLEVF